MTPTMARDDLALYLTLSPEFGGTRFGPFEGLEVRLGADRDRCHIVLPEAFGVAREHCKVIRQGEGLIVAASERTAAVFVWKGDARRPTQIQAPTSVRPGDSFALVSPEGARFTVVMAPLPAEMIAARDKKKRRNNLTAEGFAKEGWRLFVARIWSLGPVGIFMRGWYMFTSGALFQPRILIPLAIAAFGYLGAFGSSCAAMKFKSDEKKAVADLEQCNERAGVGGGFKGINSSAFELVTAVDKGDKSLGVTLEKDAALRGAVMKAITEILQNPTQYDWIIKEDGTAVSEWIKLRTQIEDSDKFDDLTKLLLPYASAVPKRTSEEWNTMLDVNKQTACTRGPARLTYRQAVSLGLETVQVDAFHGASTMGFVDDEPGRATLLRAAAIAAGGVFPDPPPPAEEALVASGTEFCTFVTGDDDRTKLSKVVSMMEKQFGMKAGFVPEASANTATLARLVKLFAADIPGNKYTVDSPLLDFSASYATPLKERPEQETVVSRSAEVIARSVALPCLAALNRADVLPTTFGRAVAPETCLLLDWKLRQTAQ